MSNAIGNAHVDLGINASEFSKGMSGVIALLKQLQTAFDNAERGSDELDNALKKTPKSFSNAAKSAREYEKQVGRANAANANLVSQFNDIGVMLAAGQNPLQLAMQQGTQISQVLTSMGGGTGALSALGSAFVGMLNPVNLATIAVIGVGAALTQKFMPQIQEAIGLTGGLTTSIEKMQEATKSMDEAVKNAKTPVHELREVWGDLADEVYRANQNAAQVAVKTQNVLAKASAKAYANKNGGMYREEYQLDPANKSMLTTESGIRAAVAKAEAKELMRLQKELGATEEQAKALLQVRKDMSANAVLEEDYIEYLVKEQELMGQIAQSNIMTGRQVANLNEELSLSKSIYEGLLASIAANTSETERLMNSEKARQEQIKKLEADIKKSEEEIRQANMVGDKTRADAFALQAARMKTELEALKEVSKTVTEAMGEHFKAFGDKAFDSFNNLRTKLGNMGNPYDGYVKEFQDAKGALDKATALIIQKENSGGFRATAGAMSDDNRYRVGYESDTITMPDGTYRAVRAGDTVDRAGADRDLQRRINGYFAEQREIMGIHWDIMTDEQKAMLASWQHNHGSLKAGKYKGLANSLAAGDLQGASNYIQKQAWSYSNLPQDQERKAKGEKPLNYNRRMEEAAVLGGTNLDIQYEGEQQLEATREANKEAERSAREQRQEAERKANEVKKYTEGLAASVEYQKKETELLAWKNEQIAAINSSNLSESEKAIALERVNAEMERQLAITKLQEEAIRRGVDLNATMTGSTMTYAEAIKALTDAKYEDAITSAEFAQQQEEVNKRQEFWNGQVQDFKDGVVQAAMAGEGLADVLKNIAAALAEALLQSALWGQGPLANGHGGLLGGMLSLGGSLLGGGGDPLAGALSGAGVGNVIPIAGAYASGGTVSNSGWQLVGEKGSELVNMNRGSQVMNNQDTQKLLRGIGESGSAAAVRIDLSPDLEGRIVDKNRQNSVQITKNGIGQYDKRGVSRAVDRYSNDPHKR